MVHIGLAGDVMIGRTVDRSISAKGYVYPWGNMLHLLRETDMNIVNLETTLTTSVQKVEKTFNFKASQDKIKTLTEARITAVNLANNHILDFSGEGLQDTLQALASGHIAHAGAGLNEETASAPLILNCRNMRVGMLGMTNNEPGWKAGPSHYGVNYFDFFSAHDQERALDQIRRVRSLADIVLVSIHWGPNMEEKPHPVFVELAHEMIGQGADIIHGHSAHIFQGIEVYRNKLILYDTGDLIDDYAVDPILRNDRSFFFIVYAENRRLLKLKLIPLSIGHCQVNLADEDSWMWSIRRMKELSASFGTRIPDGGELNL
ncbi:MAG: CapA family protein [Bacteroidota bacterium]|nr:CapA family protein [Bacteroidota bacterium]MDP4217918.1 CapA family protein [Bacteroidota bacterium]MDP4245737.1 CapA family protein [Bacteroidota bacterium]MDP4255169.1 CapA family protein [Bacteroidota bacterium]MDP4260709.1 CapA family protein [Bacteroidota bacterium]